MSGNATPPDCVAWVSRDATREPTAVALLLHGLNFQARRMGGIAELLASHGVECLNVSLRGHGAPDDARSQAASAPPTGGAEQLDAFRSASRKLWLGEARAGYDMAQARAHDRGVPLLLVGFSLGAAVGSDLASEPGSDVRFDGMIFFAPAFTVRWYTQFIRCLAPFPRLILKSFSPEDYAANPGTPIAAYNALFQSIDALHQRQARRAAADALIFVDPADELVSYRGLRALVDSPGAGHWQLVPTPKTLRKGTRDYHHLIIDEASLGSEGWATVRRSVEGFLRQLRARPAA